MKAIDLIDDGSQKLIYHPEVFAHISIDALIADIHWRQNTIRVYGKEYLEPRLTAWYGPAYKYSSIRWPEQPLTPFLAGLCSELVERTGFPFNAVLINRYRNGEDAMGWHRDNEPEIDQTLIASVSFGAARDFLVRRKGEKNKTTVTLEHGSLLLMHHLQTDYEHAIPRRKRAAGERINLTFRRIVG